MFLCMNPLRLEKILRDALEEDLGWGDITTEAVVPPDAEARAVIVSREDGIIAGLDVAKAVFRILDPSTLVEPLVPEGSPISRAAPLCNIQGRAHVILSGERVALNLTQRMSGIATAARKMAAIAEPYNVKVTDTRKTTPGLRMLEKYAVRIGGGYNHRMALDDAVLIKDNHLVAAGGVLEAVRRARRRVGPLVKIEVETESLAQVEDALRAGADVIMLDNMEPDLMREAVRLIGGRALVEASGRIRLDNIHQIVTTGIDFLSMGWLTHSAPPLDLSLEFCQGREPRGEAP